MRRLRAVLTGQGNACQQRKADRGGRDQIQGFHVHSPVQADGPVATGTVVGVVACLADTEIVSSARRMPGILISSDLEN
jgi:hypothetical protein